MKLTLVVALGFGLIGCLGVAEPARPKEGCIYTDTLDTPAGQMVFAGVFLNPERCAQLRDSFPNNTRPR